MPSPIAIIGQPYGQVKEHLISAGQGPDEVLSALFTPVTMLNYDSLIVISEGNPRSIKMLKIAGEPGVAKQINTVEMARPSNLPHYIDRNRILIESADLSKRPINRAYVLVKDGEPVSMYSDMPEDETAARMIQEFSLKNSMAVSPDGRHIAVAYLYGGTLELFAVEDTVIRNVYSHAFHPMEVPADPIEAIKENQLTRAFNKAQATNDYVFLSYSGENTPESDNKIAIFDWEGNPVKLIQTDCQIVAFAVDDKASKIYAITIPGPDGETQISKLSYTLP